MVTFIYLTNFNFNPSLFAKSDVKDSNEILKRIYKSSLFSKK